MANAPQDRSGNPSRRPGAYETAARWREMGEAAAGRQPNKFDPKGEYEYAGAGEATYWAKHAKTGPYSTAPLAPNEDQPTGFIPRRGKHEKEPF